MVVETKQKDKIKTWVGQHYPNAKIRGVTDHPWAKTWQISYGDQQYFLKQIIGDGKRKVVAAQTIAASFGDAVATLHKADADLNVMVMKDHGGNTMTYQNRSANKPRVLASYAALQATSHKINFVPGLFNTVTAVGLFDEFLSFLSADGNAAMTSSVNAAYYLGDMQAARYHLVMTAMQSVLRKYLSKADTLPRVLNHCDFRPSNMAERPDGSLVFYDWDDAVLGPVGLSLHAQFSGSLRVYTALQANRADIGQGQMGRDRDALEAYIRAFTKAKIVDYETMKSHLGASVTAGQIYYMLVFQHYPTDSKSTRKAVADNIRSRMSDLLNLCEELTIGDEDARKQLAQAFLETADERRLDGLEKSTRHPLSYVPRLNEKAVDMARTDEDAFPTVEFSDKERDAGTCLERNAKLGEALYKEHGTLLLKNALSPDLIEQCRAHVMANYERYFEEKRHDDALRVGDKRYMITLQIEGVLNQPQLYAPSTVTPIVRRLLGDNFINGSMVSVASLPGAKDQRLHKDHKALFPEDSGFSPSFAISLMVPLITLTKETGTTRIIKGSHRIARDVAEKMPHQDALIGQGDCFLMDYRVLHQGLANTTKDTVRPIITMIYQRPWFRDYINYDKQKPILISDDELGKIPKRYRHMFDWVM